jgi:signal transduction histidine kinase
MDSRQALSEELRQTRLAYQMMGYLHQFKTGFLARTSHELRSPLSSLMGLHQLILNDLCENWAEEREFVAQAYESAHKLMKIIDEIVQVSKITYGSIALDIQPIQLSQLLTDLYQLTHLQATNKSLNLDFFAPPFVQILADKSRLLQTLLMLVDTTIKIQPEGVIKLHTQGQESDNYIVLILASDCPAHLWYQGQNLPQFTPKTSLKEVQNFAQTLEASPSMKLVLAQSMLEAMGGSLEIKENGEYPTRIECLLPLMKSNGV